LAAVVIRFDHLYECASTVIVRAPARPVSWLSDRPGNAADPAADPASFISELAADSRFGQALEMSSPDLARALRRASAQRPAPRKLDRLVRSLTAYQLRMAYRPTPFGLLAGLALGSFGQPVAGRLGVRPVVGLRPDAGWLSQVVDGIERDTRVRLGPVRITPGTRMHRARDAFVVRRDTASGDARAGSGDARAAAEIRVQATPLTELVIAAAAGGTGLQELTARLAAAAPQIPAERFGVLLRTLISHGVLDTDLLPPPGAADPLGHVLTRLSPPGSDGGGPDDGGPDGGGPAAGLAAIRGRMRAIRVHETEPAAAALDELRARMRAVHPDGPLVAADTILDARVQLPPEVAREAETAAEIGWRCASGRRPGDHAARFYHRAFAERHGYGQLVPLPEVVEEITGIDQPAPAADDADARDPVLMELAVLAGAGRHREITLDEDLLERLSRPARAGDACLAPASIELHAQLISRSLADLESGRFLLAVSPQGGALQAGASLGRFAYLLPAAARRCVVPPVTAAGPGRGDGRVSSAEVVFRTRDPRLGHLAAQTGWAPHRIPVGCDDSQSGDLPVRELAVCADRSRLWLFSPVLDQFVEPLFYTMLRPDAAPPVARFLFAVASARSAGWRPWRWGPARRLPYRPRVRASRTILSPASWNIPPELGEVARHGTPSGWRTAVAAWRAASGVPDWLLCGHEDQRLPLHLDDQVHVDLLRRICRRSPAGMVSETHGGLDEPPTQTWLTGPDGSHTAEIVFPLFRRASPGAHWASAPPVPHGEHRAPAASRHGRRGLEVPGGQWLYAKIFTPPDLQDEVLGWQREQLLPAVADAGVDRWFFIRYRDPGEAGGHHLRLRFHGDPARLRDRLLPALHDWTSALCSAGLCRRVTLDTYEPETGEYGGASMIEAAECAFAADSRWVIDLLAGGLGQRQSPEQLAAASLACLAVTLGHRREPAPGVPLAPGRPDRPGRTDRPGRPGLVRELTDGTAALLASYIHDPAARPGPWVAAMRGYRQQLSASLPARDSARIAGRLLHLHENRLLGGGFADTDVVLALARAAIRKTSAGAPGRRGAARTEC
jgi:lantibiotic biosynthesis protein